MPPPGKAKTSGRPPVPPPEKAKETRSPPPLALRNSRTNPPPASLAQRKARTQTNRPAQLRRQREDATRKTALQESRDKIYADIFAGQVNPFTGKPITSEADYNAWRAEKARRDLQQQRRQTEQQLSQAGLPADALRQIINQEVEHHPAVQQARQATMQAAAQAAKAAQERANAAIQKSLAAIAAEFPDIKSLDDIAKMPTAGRFNELVQKGLGLEDAFYLANRQELDQRRRAASRQAAINAAQSKAHLNAGVAGETADAVDVPADMAESYREMMPGATDAEIRKAYASYLKSIGKK